MQPPFETGDLVEISGVTGYVQQLNMRTTILMTLDGNLAQIPNASVYKNILSNFTTNANRCENFVVGIGYDDAINEAQEIARKVLGGPPGRTERSRALGTGGQSGQRYSEPARLLLAQWPRVQLAEGALFGDPAGEARLSGPWHLDARRGPRGCLPARHSRHHARAEPTDAQGAVPGKRPPPKRGTKNSKSCRRKRKPVCTAKPPSSRSRRGRQDR